VDVPEPLTGDVVIGLRPSVTAIHALLVDIVYAPGETVAVFNERFEQPIPTPLNVPVVWLVPPVHPLGYALTDVFPLAFASSLNHKVSRAPHEGVSESESGLAEEPVVVLYSGVTAVSTAENETDL
jgi:hypothetical protein